MLAEFFLHCVDGLKLQHFEVSGARFPSSKISVSITRVQTHLVNLVVFTGLDVQDIGW